jgi:hypothetical protein
MNGDGYDEIAYIVTKDPGGSGTFYYVAVLVSEEVGWNSDTPAVLLGDRIAPQTTEIRNGVLLVNFADRAPGEPFTARPSMGVSKYLVLDQGLLVDRAAR